MTIKAGDKVKVSFEGTVLRANGQEACVEDQHGYATYVPLGADGFDIEKIVRPFQVGDRVRSKAGRSEWYVGREGYMVTAGPFAGTYRRYAASLEETFSTSNPDLELVP